MKFNKLIKPFLLSYYQQLKRRDNIHPFEQLLFYTKIIYKEVSQDEKIPQVKKDNKYFTIELNKKSTINRDNYEIPFLFFLLNTMDKESKSYDFNQIFNKSHSLVHCKRNFKQFDKNGKYCAGSRTFHIKKQIEYLKFIALNNFQISSDDKNIISIIKNYLYNNLGKERDIDPIIGHFLNQIDNKHIKVNKFFHKSILPYLL